LPILSERLELRELTVVDAPFILELLNDGDFHRYIGDRGVRTLADAENYIQHNPNVATGRRALAEQIARNVKRQAAQAQIKAPVVAIVAEGNLVVVSLVSELPDPADSSKKYTTTWFDMFRIENGKIAEHWDSAVRLP
jgi:predicted SnoaL-like aldol condensation-catalyzing enzyme